MRLTGVCWRVNRRAAGKVDTVNAIIQRSDIWRVTTYKGVRCMESVSIYDSTLRDGMQAEGLSFSVDDKIKIARKLDALGIDYIEAGNPTSNPKDMEFFRRAGELALRHARLCAFGSTHRVGSSPKEDEGLRALLKAETPVVTVFGKAWELHVLDILKTDLQTNLQIISGTVRYLKEHGREVVFDAEHFFDGYQANPDYALEALRAAAAAGADCIVLCDTNGAAFPTLVGDAVKRVCTMLDQRVGIHCHNDVGMAVANTMLAVEMGARHVQGTINGIGERCGNVNLCTVIPNLELKTAYTCIGRQHLTNMASAARYISEIANLSYDERQPYVGGSAFAHKAGMHVDGVMKNPKTFEHIEPELVGNTRRVLVSEMSGRANLLEAIQRVDPSLDKHSPQTKQVMEKLKELEYEGYQFEGAESSLELLIRKEIGRYRPFFTLNQFKVIVSEPSSELLSSSALVKIHVDDKVEITAAEGNGPVDALDSGLRKALERFYPQLAEVRLTDFKVRVLDSQNATASKVRVLVESTDGTERWSTVGVSTDIIEASWHALVDSVEYKLFLDSRKKGKDI